MTDTRENIKAQPRDARGKLLPKVVDSPLATIYAAVNDAFVSIRQRHPEIPNVMLVVGASGKRPGASGLNLGTFSPKSWESKTAEHEIVISGESLKNGPADVLATLLHESAHALAEKRGIKDTSRQGRFHNKRFRELAEEVGIEVEHSKTLGWSTTTLPPETAKLYRTEIANLKKALKGYRLLKVDAAKPKTTARWVSSSTASRTTSLTSTASARAVTPARGAPSCWTRRGPSRRRP
jgi:hypothetical protein